MLLYAISLLIFVCPIAATEPRIIDAIAIKIRIVFHSSKAALNATNKICINAPIPATLGAKVKKAVTDVGEPS